MAQTMHYTHADVMRMRARTCYVAAAITALIGTVLIITGVLVHLGHGEHTAVWIFNPGLTSFGVTAMLAVAGANYDGHAAAARMRGRILEQVGGFRAEDAARHREVMANLAALQREILTGLNDLTAALTAAEQRVEDRIDGIDEHMRERLRKMAEASSAQAAAVQEVIARQGLRAVGGHHLS
ncbi:hypothetical protein [Thermomonospora cellulosilytica]|uniref:Uncharacterized protein n=1 Tax=Thermomonospora cellulosilytica TaxID=1411118 RepID=A0A7W3MXL0_9ACTN|nr:hypothetical protein [Thermomonospora cellulosilytica]MBA9003709.1 hypothetical protein [Thermomonospora cellulosilytica]